MAMTLWTSSKTGRTLDDVELKALRLHARRVYDANTHIFEDEADALTALGVVSYTHALADLAHADLSLAGLDSCRRPAERVLELA